MHAQGEGSLIGEVYHKVFDSCLKPGTQDFDNYFSLTAKVGTFLKCKCVS